MKTLKGILLTH